MDANEKAIIETRINEAVFKILLDAFAAQAVRTLIANGDLVSASKTAAE